MGELSSMLAVVPVILLSAGFAPGLVAPRCACCSELLQPDGELEMIATWRGWYFGWRRFACSCCGQVHTRLALTRDKNIVQVATHRIG